MKKKFVDIMYGIGFVMAYIGLWIFYMFHG